MNQNGHRPTIIQRFNGSVVLIVGKEKKEYRSMADLMNHWPEASATNIRHIHGMKAKGRFEPEETKMERFI